MNNLKESVKKVQGFYDWIINFINKSYKNVIGGLIIVFGLYSVWWIIKVISDTPQPSGALNIHTDTKKEQLGEFDKSIPKDFYFFQRVGTDNTSQWYDYLTPQDLAKKCLIFKDECIGFDSRGNVILNRDSDRLRFSVYDDGNKGYYKYLPKQGEFNRACEDNFGGVVDGNKCLLSSTKARNIIDELNAAKEKEKPQSPSNNVTLIE